MLDSNAYYQILKSGSVNDHYSLFQSLPDIPLKEELKFLVTTGNPLHRYMAFGSLVIPYANGANFQVGEGLGHALYQYGKELFESGEKNLLLMTLMGHAHNYVNAAMNLGNYDQALSFIDQELPFWQHHLKNHDKTGNNDQKGIQSNYKTLLVAKFGLLMQLNQIDQAWRFLQEFENEMVGNPASDIEYNRLKNNLMNIRKEVGEKEPGQAERQEKLKEGQKATTAQMLNSLKQMMRNTGLDQKIFNKFSESEEIDAFSKEGFKKLEDILSKGESYLTRGFKGINEISLRQTIRRASGIFVDNQPEPSEIEKSLNTLVEALQQARDMKNVTLINDALYGLYLCYSRLNQSSEAADQLIPIRKNLEIIRNSIAEPLQKGGVFETYPYLFYSMVEHLYNAGRYQEMLDAIEGAKGRAITDTLIQTAGETYLEFDMWNINQRLQPLLARENAHYLSLHVDDEFTYACLLTKKGNILANKIPIGKQHLNQWLSKGLNDPRNWRKQLFKVDIIAKLSPLINWFSSLFTDKEIASEDHLCYSTDHLLYSFPLHYLMIGDQSLIENCTVSRVHNAGHLIYLMSIPVVKPDHAMFINVPSAEDDQSTREKFARNQDDLQLYFTGYKLSRLVDGNASLSNVLQNLAQNQLTHFATHGFFPRNRNPFTSSGLLLSDKGQLPMLQLSDPDHGYELDGMHLLSPRRLLKDAGSILGRRIDLNGSHISLQACVSGYAAEGVAGDALGIEWAFFQTRAHSMISTFWNVDIDNSADFYSYFYREWLGNGFSKARAHQKATLILRKASHYEGVPHEYFWAAYGLTGDWR